MKISYLVTCSTENETLSNLLEKLDLVIPYEEDEVVVVADKDTENDVTNSVLNRFSNKFRILYHPLAKNYGAHKNWGAEQCKGEWIFQIDGDELPADYTIGENIHAIIAANPNVDLIYVPRINDFKGVTPEHARHWNWKLSPSTSIIHEKVIDTNSIEYKFLKENGYILEETVG